jgi:hypothetical protein
VQYRCEAHEEGEVASDPTGSSSSSTGTGSSTRHQSSSNHGSSSIIDEGEYISIPLHPSTQWFRVEMASLLPPWALLQVQLVQLASQQQCKAAHLQALVTMLTQAERLGGAVAAAVKTSLLQPVLLQLLPHLHSAGGYGIGSTDSSSSSSVNVGAGSSDANSTASTAAARSSSGSTSGATVGDSGSSIVAAGSGSSSSRCAGLDHCVSLLLLKLMDRGEGALVLTMVQLPCKTCGLQLSCASASVTSCSLHAGACIAVTALMSPSHLQARCFTA